MTEFAEGLVGKLKDNPTIAQFKEITSPKTYGSFSLAGGAVIDILEGREPKDYDFIDWSQEDVDRFRAAGFKHVYTTNSSITMEKDGIVVQFISYKKEQFGFKIEQAAYRFCKEELTIDRDSFENKVLIPVSFDLSQNIRSAAMRIPHWQNKGYHIPDLTYLSLMSAVFSIKSNNS